MTPIDPHLTEEQLAVLLDGETTAAEERTAMEHLSSCRACMASYSDAARVVHSWRGEPKRSNSSPAVSSGNRMRFLVAACLALVIVVGAWSTFVDQSRMEKDYLPVQVALQNHLIESSYFGPVLPGTENAVWAPPETTRGGLSNDPQDQELEDLLDGESGPRPEPIAEIGGWLALNDLHMARIRLKKVEKTHPADTDLLILKGILVYRDAAPPDEEMELKKAERHLRAALIEAPGNPVARFNLALVLIDLEQEGEARKLLQDLTIETGHPFVTHRALGELNNLDSQD